MENSKFAPLLLPFSAAAAALTDFIPGAGNRELIAALHRLADGRGDVPSVYVWGAPGSGKSTLLRAACAHARGVGQPAYFAADGGSLPPLTEGLLAADDVNHLDNDAQTTLLDWYARAAHPWRRQFLLVSADCAPRFLSLRKELASHFAAGLVFRLQPLSDADKSQALAAWAKRRGFILPAEISDFLLTRLPRNMHTLTAALTELDGFFLHQKKPLTVRRVSAWLMKREMPAEEASAPHC